MKYFYVCFVALALSTALWAQVDCPCEQTVSVADPACTSPFDCVSRTGCASTTFTASCTGYYTYTISVLCEGEDCSDYNLCANIYEGANPLPNSNCHNNNVGCDPCSHTCDSICLQHGHTYTLYACLTTCGGDCPSPSFCDGHATLTYCGYGATSCP
jgi:hypothetical protein